MSSADVDTRSRGGRPDLEVMRHIQLRGQVTALAQNSVALREPLSGRALAGCIIGGEGTNVV